MRILAATDLSPHAQAAGRAAAALAKAHGASLTLVHILDYIGAEAAFHDGSITAPLKTLVDADAEELTKEFGIKVDVMVTPGFADETVAAIADQDDDVVLVVVGSLGRRKQNKWLIGSTAERISQTCTKPVLVVRDPVAFVASANGAALKVVAAVEPGPASRPPLELLATWRKRAKLNLTVAHIAWPQREHARLGVMGPMPFETLHPDVAGPLNRELLAFCGTVPGLDPAGTSTTYLVHPGWGRTDNHVAQLAADLDADVVVVGTHRRQGFAKLWHGSVSRGVVSDATMSVLVVPGPDVRAPDVTGPLPELTRVVVPLDFSQLADRAVPVAYGLAGPNGTVHLVHIITPKSLPLPDAEAELRGRIPATAPKTTKTTVEVVRAEDPARTIAAIAARTGATAICIATHGRGGVTRTVMGSQAETLLRTVNIPVVVVPPK